MKRILTRDGSYTWIDEAMQEAYHSMGGAVEEAERVYVTGCRLDQRARALDRIHILDIGFGLGYNVFVAIQKIREANPRCRVWIVSFESSPRVLDFMDYPESIRALATQIKSNWKKENDRITYRDESTELVIELGDARKMIHRVQHPVDAVFLDPFSPPKNPELWTVDFFRALKRCLNRDGSVATYSVATPVITGLLEAGFFPLISSGTSTKRYSLTATLEKQGDLPQEFLRKLTSSPERFPYYDETLSLSREALLQNRKHAKGSAEITPMKTKVAGKNYGAWRA